MIIQIMKIPNNAFDEGIEREDVQWLKSGLCTEVSFTYITSTQNSNI